ncbi:MAG: hypothetical protein R3E87_07330 [Burkholderiaceae bacterium]
MLEALGMVIGFLAPLMAPALKLLQGWFDNKHELAMLDKRLEHAGKAHEWRMAEIDARADIKEMMVLRQPAPSFAVALLHAAKDHLPWWMAYPVFVVFAAIDALNNAIRPLTLVALLSLYGAVKWATFTYYTGEHGLDADQALIAVWTSDDRAILLMVLAYFFGNRTAKKLFGDASK